MESRQTHWERGEIELSSFLSFLPSYHFSFPFTLLFPLFCVISTPHFSWLLSYFNFSPSLFYFQSCIFLSSSLSSFNIIFTLSYFTSLFALLFCLCFHLSFPPLLLPSIFSSCLVTPFSLSPSFLSLSQHSILPPLQFLTVLFFSFFLFSSQSYHTTISFISLSFSFCAPVCVSVSWPPCGGDSVTAVCRPDHTRL